MKHEKEGEREGRGGRVSQGAGHVNKSKRKRKKNE
jgi:hypothetical protein